MGFSAAMGYSARQCRTALAAVGNFAKRPGERRARTDAGWFNRAARVLAWLVVIRCIVRVRAVPRAACEMPASSLVWPFPPALEARRRPPPAPLASPAKLCARQLPKRRKTL